MTEDKKSKEGELVFEFLKLDLEFIKIQNRMNEILKEIEECRRH